MLQTLRAEKVDGLLPELWSLNCQKIHLFGQFKDHNSGRKHGN